MIKAQIIADSKADWNGSRLTTFVVTFPRIVLAELNTHRVFSRNSASSRAIPFKKMIKRVDNDPFIPIAWQKDHKGMQGREYFSNPNDIERNKSSWLRARRSAMIQAEHLNECEVTKQLCNRLLEPFLWHTAIITASTFENFFKLRCPQYTDTHGNTYRSRRDYRREVRNADTIPTTDLQWRSIDKGGAEIHIAALAEAMWDAYNDSTPRVLQEGQWHIPFGDQFDGDRLLQVATDEDLMQSQDYLKVKIATARCARVSYLNFEGRDDYEADIKLHDRLASMGHFSPFEHCAKIPTNQESVLMRHGNNLSGNLDQPWIQYRKTLLEESGRR